MKSKQTIVIVCRYTKGTLREFDDDASREYLDTQSTITLKEVSEDDTDDRHPDFFKYAATRAAMASLVAMDSDGLDSGDWICAYDKETGEDLTLVLKRAGVYEDMF
mgnify:CR=1 FL=1